MASGFENSDWMFSNTYVPWHGIGTITKSAQRAKDALQLGRLDWDTIKEELYLYQRLTQEEIMAMSEDARKLVQQIAFAQKKLMENHQVRLNMGKLQAVKGYAATVRSDRQWGDNERFLGVVGGSYQPISNEACFDLIDRVVGQMGAVYETAGSLRSGKQVFLLARCPDSLKVRDDVLIPYLLLSTAHDGSGKLVVKLTCIRVVCNNTLSVALADNSTAAVAVKHTKGNVGSDGRVNAGVIKDVKGGIVAKMGSAAEAAGVENAGSGIVTFAHSYMNAQIALFNRMAETEISPKFVADYLNCLVPDPLNGSSATRASNKREEIRTIHYGVMPGDAEDPRQGGKQQEAISIDRRNGSSTAYRLFNAITHFNDHVARNVQTVDKTTGERRSEAESRFARIFDADDENFRDVATRLLMEGIETNSKNFKDALAKAKELRESALDRQRMMVAAN